MKKIVITLAAFAALSTAAFANDGGNDNSTFNDGQVNGSPVPQDQVIVTPKSKHYSTQYNVNGINNDGYLNYIEPEDQRHMQEQSRGAQ